MGLRGRALMVIVGLVLTGGHELVIAVLNLLARADGRDPVERLPTLGMVLLLVTAALFVSWLFSARDNLETAGVRLRWNAFWATVGWVLPVVCLVVPLLVMDETDRESQRLRSGARKLGPFAFWAGAWTVYQIAEWILFFTGENGHLLSALVGGLLAVAAVAAVLLVRQITEAQTAAAIKDIDRPAVPG